MVSKNETINNIIKEVNQCITEFERIYKCLNNSNQLKKETNELHVNNIIVEYNHLKGIYISNRHLLDEDHKSQLSNLLTKSHDKLFKIFERLNLQVQIPRLNITKPEVKIENLDSEVKVENNSEKMAITVIDIINLSTKVIPEYDGSPEELQRFFDAIALIKKKCW